YIEAWESRHDPLAKKYPLQLVTPHSRVRAHSTFANVPWLNELESQVLRMSAVDARARGIKDGDDIRVFNGRGEIRVKARVTQRLLPGVVSLHQGAWYKPDATGIDRGGCANVLTKDECSPGGAFITNTCLVQVERVTGNV
ncbi:MAG: molybdopterin dinucleotide binding domain-containing protein, partial [Chloroflexota bacterium]